jgi:glycerophosphoryl diester phosphodiesterase
VILLDPSARPIIAHRGASADYPENTMLAFEQALAVGADALEFDVRLSSDGIPVVIHDSTVDRTTKGKGAVKDLTAGDLARLDAGAGQSISSVADVLEAFADVPLIIEVKEVPVALPLAGVIRSHGASRRVLVGSFQHAALRCFDNIEIGRSASKRETAIFWLGSRFRWASSSRAYGAFTVPERHNSLHVVDEAFVSAATRNRMPVHVWTVDDRFEAERLRALGIAGIITNRPDCMQDLERS